MVVTLKCASHAVLWPTRNANRTRGTKTVVHSGQLFAPRMSPVARRRLPVKARELPMRPSNSSPGTPSHLALLPLEDALALEDQPNLPGTIEEQPNWRRRYSGEARQLLEQPGVRQRLQPLAEREDP